MKTNEQRILLFDIDGTLLDSAREAEICFRRALEDVYGACSPTDTYEMDGKTAWLIVNELMHMAGFDAETIETRRVDAFAAYTRHEEIAAPYFGMRLLPGVAPLLDRLASDPCFVLGLVTGNVREAVPYKLRSVGIDPSLFTFGAFGCEHLDRNTLPALALYRLSQMQGVSVTSQSAMVIGDTQRDIACARHAGLKVLCVATGQFEREVLSEGDPDYLLDNLADTDAVMAILKSF